MQSRIGDGVGLLALYLQLMAKIAHDRLLRMNKRADAVAHLIEIEHQPASEPANPLHHRRSTG